MEVVLPWSNKPTGCYLYLKPNNSSLGKEDFNKKQLSHLSDIPLPSNNTDLFSCVIGWQGLGYDGKEICFNLDNLSLLRDKAPWVAEQISKKLKDVNEWYKELIEETILFADHSFRMSSRQSDGSSLKEHMDNAKSNPFASASMIAVVEQEEPPSLPEAAAYVWSYFLRLHSGRGQGGLGGFLPLNYQEIESFCNMEKVELESWELDMIKSLDACFLKVSYEQQEKESKKK